MTQLRSCKSALTNVLCRIWRINVLLMCVAISCLTLYLMYYQPKTYHLVLTEPIYKNGTDTFERIYDFNEPLIFIGGMPRSGTTLLRAMLDAHPDVGCGKETHVVPQILQMRSQMRQNIFGALRLEEAGITDKVLDKAMASFIIEIIANHQAKAPRLCNKDPFTLREGEYLSHLFPNSKFLFIIRDGRASVHSIITRKVGISGFDLTSYRQCLEMWNKVMVTFNEQCTKLGDKKCLPVYYEKLVLNPEEWMTKVLSFLNLTWDNAVLHHETLINKPGGIELSLMERSTDQVVKPINTAALTAWVGEIPKDVVDDMPNIAPMLAKLGYDPLANPPDYGKPSALVVNNTLLVQNNPKFWEDKVKEMEPKPPPKKKVKTKNKKKPKAKSQN